MAPKDDDDLEAAQEVPLIEKPKVSNSSKAVSACALYSACSVSMILVNKSLASRYVVDP